MSEHELLTVTYTVTGFYVGKCACGWVCQRTRERDVRREHRKHSADAVKLPPRDHTFTPIDGERE